MLSGPEMAILLKQFEEEYIPDEETGMPEYCQHHEQGLPMQKTFQRHVISLCDTIRRMGNAFLDDFPDLVTLDSRNCTDESVTEKMRSLEDTCNKQYNDFFKKVLDVSNYTIYDPVQRNFLALFSNPKRKATTQQGKNIKVLQNNVELFGQLDIFMQNQDGDLSEYFAHEIQTFPLSLSGFG